MTRVSRNIYSHREYMRYLAPGGEPVKGEYLPIKYRVLEPGRHAILFKGQLVGAIHKQGNTWLLRIEGKTIGKYKVFRDAQIEANRYFHNRKPQSK